MAQFVESMQVRIKSTSSGLMTFVLRLLSGMILGLTLALVGEEIIGYGSFSFALMVVAVSAVFLRRTRKWGATRVLVFDLICVLVGMLLRMYILVAPGA